MEKTYKPTIALLLFVAVSVLAAGKASEKPKDIFASKESWTKALGNKRLLKNPAFKYVKTDPRLPRVLIYGDSISIGYTAYGREFLKGKVTVQRIPCNGGDTASGFTKLKQAGMEKGKWDVIHFNWGLHDLKYIDKKGRRLSVKTGTQVRSVKDYKKNLVELVKLLKSSGAKLVFATTTPVGPGNAGRVQGDAKKYNKAAVDVMKKNHIQINDLYSLVYPKLKEYQLHNNVHYNQAGYKAMARQVAFNIFGALHPKEFEAQKERLSRLQCVNHLSILGKLAFLYTDDHRGWFPVVENGRAHESLQLLVDSFEGARTDPGLYICPGSKQVPAVLNKDPDKPFKLGEDNVSYAWRTKRLRHGKPARTVLACDKSLDNHHGKGINVLYIDGSVRWISKEELGDGGLDAFIKKHHLGAVQK